METCQPRTDGETCSDQIKSSPTHVKAQSPAQERSSQQEICTVEAEMTDGASAKTYCNAGCNQAQVGICILPAFEFSDTPINDTVPIRHTKPPAPFVSSKAQAMQRRLGWETQRGPGVTAGAAVRFDPATDARLMAEVRPRPPAAPLNPYRLTCRVNATSNLRSTASRANGPGAPTP